MALARFGASCSRTSLHLVQCHVSLPRGSATKIRPFLDFEALILGARCLKSGTGQAAARRRQGRAAVEKRGVGDRILNEWCAPFVSSEIEWVAPFDEFWGCERADCGLSFYPSCSAILRRRGPHSVRYRAGEGASKGCCSKMGHFLATPTSARNAPSATPGDRARARHCVSGLFCVRDDPAEIAGCQLRRFV